MTDEKELSDLRERIGRLGTRDQVWLLEMVLADNRRRWDEEVARQRAATLAFLELEKRQQTTATSVTVPPEAKREAG